MKISPRQTEDSFSVIQKNGPLCVMNKADNIDIEQSGLKKAQDIKKNYTGATGESNRLLKHSLREHRHFEADHTVKQAHTDLFSYILANSIFWHTNIYRYTCETVHFIFQFFSYLPI